MKITNEQISALQESEARRKPGTAEEGFEALFAEELGSQKAQGKPQASEAQSVMRQHAVSPFPTAEMSAVAAIAGDSDAATAQMRMEGLFSGMEDYAGALSSNDPAALRNAYSLLENMTGEIASFRAAYPDMETQQPELAAMVNELEVLAVTETFKFNRGDYL